MRRRQRRLRSWLRHERQTVAMELAAALHHSRDVGPGTHAGLRAQKAASSREEAGVESHHALRGLKTLPPGMRPEQLPEAPGPQRCDRTVRGTSVGAPLLAVQSLRGFDGVDNTAAKFLLQQALKLKKEEEEEKEREQARKKKEAQEKADLELAKRDPWWAQHLADKKAMEERRNKASSSSKRKRRKRRTPRTSSLPGRARRRQRQWFACGAGFTGDDAPRIMFPSGVVRPKMLRIMAGLVQKDSCSGMARLVLLVILHLAQLSLVFMVVSVFCAMLGSTLDTCRLVRCNVRVHSSSCGALLGVVHSPFQWLDHRCHCNCRDLVLFVLRECFRRDVVWWCFFTPGGAYDSVWDCVRPITGNYLLNYFHYQEVVGCICMLNDWFSSYDEICPHNFYYSRFKLKGKCRSEKLEVYLDRAHDQYQEDVGASACSMIGSAATTVFAPTTTTIPGSS